jgi:hypothetical protein
MQKDGPFIKCKKCPYHKDYKPPPGTDSATDDMVEVAAMKLAYLSGMYTTQVTDVNIVPFVDITVDEEGELNTGKWEQKNVSYGKL